MCQVHISEGEVNEPQPNEQVHLSLDQINQGIRLACQTRPLQNIRMELLYPICESKWRIIPKDDYFLDTHMNVQSFKS